MIGSIENMGFVKGACKYQIDSNIVREFLAEYLGQLWNTNENSKLNVFSIHIHNCRNIYARGVWFCICSSNSFIIAKLRRFSLYKLGVKLKQSI